MSRACRSYLAPPEDKKGVTKVTVSFIDDGLLPFPLIEAISMALDENWLTPHLMSSQLCNGPCQFSFKSCVIFKMGIINFFMKNLPILFFNISIWNFALNTPFDLVYLFWLTKMFLPSFSFSSPRLSSSLITLAFQLSINSYSLLTI